MTPPATYRIAHYGTGQTGSIALRQILARPHLELVGHRVHDPAKVGCDSGELVGAPAVGITATADADVLLGDDVDCVTYFATDFGRDPDDVIGEMCELLEAGKNVVTTSHTPLVFPGALPPALLDRLEAACARGSSSFFATGIAPGFTTDALVLTAASLSGSLRAISIQERVPQRTYRDPLAFRALGFGTPLDGDAGKLPPGVMVNVWRSTLEMLAAGLGAEVGEMAETRDTAPADRDYELPAGAIAEGTVASVRLGVNGVIGAETTIELSVVYSMTDHMVDEWQPRIPEGSDGRRLTRIALAGEPNIELDLRLSGSDLPGTIATAARAVNSIPTTCEAPAGVHSALTLPVLGIGAVAPVLQGA
jgi:hypothetical protein